MITMMNIEVFNTLTAVSGSVYVFVSVDNGLTWSEQQKLLASDGVANDLFGTAVSVYEETVVVGARDDGNEKGSQAGCLVQSLKFI